MSAPSPYKKLPGLGHQFAAYTRLYLGPDHLLQVSTAAFTERYKRFYFRDIQAVILVRTQNWIWWNAGLGGLGALVLFIAILTDDTIGVAILGTIGMLLLGGAAVSAKRGPSCRCHIRTAVQTEVLPSLNRIRRADKVLTSIKPLIDAVQGPLAAGPTAPAATDVGGADQFTILPPEDSPASPL